MEQFLGRFGRIKNVFKLFLEDLLGLQIENQETTNKDAYKQAIDLLLNIRLDAKKQRLDYF